MLGQHEQTRFWSWTHITEIVPVVIIVVIVIFFEEILFIGEEIVLIATGSVCRMVIKDDVQWLVFTYPKPADDSRARQ